MGKLQGKVAFITGAGRGLGRSIARRFAEEGARVAVTSFTEANAMRVAGEIMEAGGTAFGLACDVSDEAQIQAAIERTVKEYGRLDVLVNNAYDIASSLSSVLDLSVEMLDRQLATGPVACLRTMQAAYPHLKESGEGRVINFASSVGVLGLAGSAPYVMAKEAIRALTRVAAREWGADNITVNNILPIAASDSTDANTKNADGEVTWVPTMPIARIGSPDEDISPVALFLASAEGRFLTGYSLTPDGGFLIDAGR